MRLALAFGLVVTAAAAFGGVYAFKYAATATGSGGTAMTSAAAPAMSPVAPSGSVVASVVTTTTGQSPPPAPAPARAVIPSAAAVAAPAPPTLKTPVPVCNNPNALGVSRVVEIDTTGGPGFGFEHFKNYDFLKEGEVVFTFDDGPWLNNTPMVLKALADQCVRATFFPIGKHATYYPDILKKVAEAGHTVGNHTWSHQDLSKKTFEEGKQEIEMGMSAVRMALGAPGAPFFRFPALRHPPELVTYLGERNVAIFSTDFDSFDFTMRKPEQVIKAVMDKLKKHGKGIALMHDFQQATAHAVPELLVQIKAAGYKVVHMKPRTGLDTLAQYDDMVIKEQKIPTMAGGRPTASVVRTIEE